MASVRPLRSEDMDALRRLFLDFPCKAVQQRFQNSDPRALAAYFVGVANAHLGKGAAAGCAQWVGEDDKGALAAFAALHRDEWHSRFYPLRCGRVAPFLTHLASGSLRSKMAEVVVGAAREDGLEHLAVRIDGSEYEALRVLQSRGFYLVDCSPKFSARLPDVPRLPPPSSARGTSIRDWREEDLAPIQSIVSTSHPFNHYYNDPHLPREATSRLFSGWVEKCCRQLAWKTFVLERGGRVCGFIVYLNPAALNKAVSTRLVVLDLVCLAEEMRGGGVGRWFIAETLHRLAADFALVELRTSHINLPAIACYESLGMRTVSCDFILHWTEKGTG